MKQIKNRAEAEESMKNLATAEACLAKIAATVKQRKAALDAKAAEDSAEYDTIYRREWDRLCQWAHANAEMVGTGLVLSCGTLGLRVAAQPALETREGTSWSDVITALVKKFGKKAFQYLTVKTEVKKSQLRLLPEEELLELNCIFDRKPRFYVDTNKTA